MRILVSNDDGFDSRGIRTLRDTLLEKDGVVLVAPSRDRSGASNSLTLEYPIRAVEMSEGIYRVDGTPTDCVHLAITGLLDEVPDMVVSGINAGGNLVTMCSTAALWPPPWRDGPWGCRPSPSRWWAPIQPIIRPVPRWPGG